MSETESAAIKPTALAKEADISVPYASQLLAGIRAATPTLALTIFRKTGIKVRPIRDASDEDIAALARVLGSDAA